MKWNFDSHYPNRSWPRRKEGTIIAAQERATVGGSPGAKEKKREEVTKESCTDDDFSAVHKSA
jgi:hypothetical protein